MELLTVVKLIAEHIEYVDRSGSNRPTPKVSRLMRKRHEYTCQALPRSLLTPTLYRVSVNEFIQHAYMCVWLFVQLYGCAYLRVYFLRHCIVLYSNIYIALLDSRVHSIRKKYELKF